MREGRFFRKTQETSVDMRVLLPDISQDVERPTFASVHTGRINTGCGFLDHMLVLMAVHGNLELEVQASGDIRVDYHHLVEDVGISLGECLAQALGDRAGIERYGNCFVPMDESLAQATVDVSGRPFFLARGKIPSAKVGDFDTELIWEFLRSMAMRSDITLHVNLHYASNAHHACESIIKSAAHALRIAVSRSSWTSGIPSSKGVI